MYVALILAGLSCDAGPDAYMIREWAGQAVRTLDRLTLRDAHAQSQCPEARPRLWSAYVRATKRELDDLLPMPDWPDWDYCPCLHAGYDDIGTVMRPRPFGLVYPPAAPYWAYAPYRVEAKQRLTQWAIRTGDLSYPRWALWWAAACERENCYSHPTAIWLALWHVRPELLKGYDQ